MQNFQQQYSREVITGSSDDLQHIVYDSDGNRLDFHNRSSVRGN